MNFLAKIRHRLWAEKIKGQTMLCGLAPDAVDERDFTTGVFGWGEYQPKQARLILPSISTKNQGNYQTCQWNATAAQKEPDEGVVLSVQSIVAYGRSVGLVGQDGLSALRSGQKVLADFGIAEDSLLPNPNMNNFDEYSSARVLTPQVVQNAAKHKIASYWLVQGRSDTLKILDQGRQISTGMMWYSGFNMGSGFSSPWIITKNVGFQIGGHAFKMVGYDMNYQGQKVYAFKNSYGEQWGDLGLFYVGMDFFDQVGYQRWANLDIEPDAARILLQYDGKYIKNSRGGIYFVENGTKRPFENWTIFLAHYGASARGVAEKIDDGVIAKIPDGPPIQITETAGWPLVHEMAQPDNLKLIQQYSKLPI